MDATAIILLALALVALFLMLQRWFRIWAFAVGGLASCFAMLASIIHFQVFGAVIFFFLMSACGSITAAIAEGGHS